MFEPRERICVSVLFIVYFVCVACINAGAIQSTHIQYDYTEYAISMVQKNLFSGFLKKRSKYDYWPIWAKISFKMGAHNYCIFPMVKHRKFHIVTFATIEEIHL